MTIIENIKAVEERLKKEAKSKRLKKEAKSEIERTTYEILSKGTIVIVKIIQSLALEENKKERDKIE